MNIPEIVTELLARPTFREDLIFWLSLEAFEEVPGWRRWDTGDKGYSFPIRSDEEEEGVTLVLEEDDYGSWDWILYDKRSRRVSSGGYRLAGKAAEEGLAAYHALLPTGSTCKTSLNPA